MKREAADWAGEILELAESGLRRIGETNAAGEDETTLLRPLRELLEEARCPADRLLEEIRDDMPSRGAVIGAAGL
jgi:gamma-glutamylcysteine synthetase